MINKAKQRLLKNWHPMRFIALGLGIFLAYGGFSSSEPALGLLSLFFLFQAATNTGCMVGHCAGNSCNTGLQKVDESKESPQTIKARQSMVNSGKSAE